MTISLLADDAHSRATSRPLTEEEITAVNGALNINLTFETTAEYDEEGIITSIPVDSIEND